MTMKTPGVYIVEKSAFPNSVVQVATAVPAFVGYTARAMNGDLSLKMAPTRLTSLAEFHAYFGGAPEQVFDIVDAAPGGVLPSADFVVNDTTRHLKPTKPDFCLYAAMLLFFQNGGTCCYVVSVGSYAAEVIDADALSAGIETLKKEPEVTMLVVPETTRLSGVSANALEAVKAHAASGFSDQVHQKMLRHCGAEMKNRFAILDMHRGHLPPDNTALDPVKLLRTAVGTENLDFGATYYPWLHSTVFQSRDFTFENIGIEARPGLAAELKKSVADDVSIVPEIDRILSPQLLPEGSEDADLDARPDPVVQTLEAGEGFVFAATDPVQMLNPQGAVMAEGPYETPDGIWSLAQQGGDYELTFAPKPSFVGMANIKLFLNQTRLNPGEDMLESERVLHYVSAKVPAPDVAQIDKILRAICPAYGDVMDAICRFANALPPGAAMAGIYTAVDNSRGVWKAPANVSVNSVAAPMVAIDHAAQEDLNVSTTGKSINAIRPFVDEGTLVWGARTLDGNSSEWRYINIRRTMIMIEESIRLACKAYVFEPNTAQTWVTMRSMIENFLTSVWKQGGLAGAVPDDAFSVRLELGDTMTATDILDGILRVTVLVAVTRPAEFIVIDISQQMQRS